jgi:hypothetical protein
MGIPVPLPSHFNDQHGFRTGSAARAINAGGVQAATLEEVALTLGEPDAAIEGPDCWAYMCDKTRGRVVGFMAMVAPPAGGAVLPMAVPYGDIVLLLIEFDDQGRVARQEVLELQKGDPVSTFFASGPRREALHEVMRQWARRGIGQAAPSERQS